MEEADYVLGGLDRSRWIEIRYEDYCCDPDATLDQLHRFLSVAPGRQPKDFRSVEHHVVGNGMRLDTTSEVRLDERWRKTLTKSDMRTFNAVAGEVNRRYGYQ